MQPSLELALCLAGDDIPLFLPALSLVRHFFGHERSARSLYDGSGLFLFLLSLFYERAGTHDILETRARQT